MNARDHLRRVKYELTKIFGLPDNGRSMRVLEDMINQETWARHDEILAEAQGMLADKEKYESAHAYESSNDPIVRQGYDLKNKVLAAFKNKYAGKTSLRILIHTPDEKQSPGGYSAMRNLAESLQFVGVPVREFSANENLQDVLTSFKPNLFIIIDHAIFLNTIDWPTFVEHRKAHGCNLALIAQLEEYGNAPLPPRLAWAKNNNVSFYVSFRDHAYTHSRKEYRPFFEAGYEIISVMFGANPLHYYPLPGISRDLDYSFLGSTNNQKSTTYLSLAGKIFKNYPGFIDGPGWRSSKHFIFDRDRDRYIYARSKVGLNFHMPDQMAWGSEVNERTHMLAMSGVPQVIDNPKLLPSLYSADALFISKNGREYVGHFKKIIQNPEYGAARALKAQKEAFEKNTTFHRAEQFILDIETFLGKDTSKDRPKNQEEKKTGGEHTKPKISVVLPVYNGEKYLAEAIESVLDQTFSDFELIIVNDGSKDGTKNIIETYAKKDPRVVHIECEQNGGIVKALNRGLAAAKGEYIARLDADDISLPERFKKQVAFFDAHPNIAVVGTWGEIIKADKTRIRIKQKPADFADIRFPLLLSTQLIHTSVMMRAEPLKKLGGYDQAYVNAEDFDLWNRFADKGYELANIPEVLVQFRVLDEGITANPVTQNIQRSNALLVNRRSVAPYIQVSQAQLERLVNFFNGERQTFRQKAAAFLDFRKLVLSYLKRGAKTEYEKSRVWKRYKAERWQSFASTVKKFLPFT